MTTVRAVAPGGVLLALGLSAATLAATPALLPHEYSWVAHTTSEAAAQGVDGAWLARLGFLLFGFAAIWLAVLRRRFWGRWATGLHSGFGVLMVAAAAFSTRSWVASTPYDPVENLLHSVAATALGFAFSLGVLAVAVRRWRRGGSVRALDAAAVGAAIVLPLAMTAFPAYAGVGQRGMFLVAYSWYGREAVIDWHRQSRPVADTA